MVLYDNDTYMLGPVGCISSNPNKALEYIYMFQNHC